ncbi:hypothetical protein SAMN04488550_3409 [Gordonia malaquae]|uniref:Uncharacterized protein n=1 Tax=Gordonia malaquae NBRC 108250 TaxID=1223542 RepID=M3US19_GORML|nr:UPF0182 family protein [Gordonia malaquae]GAC78017.1 hypothetical protein GM1_001_01420 [Gordonia malaquae NBRC 108250]SED89256.1 hypothetical protein SAMN04488550_3409 [Gordonia malaquae]
MVGVRGPIGRPTLSRRSKILIGIGVALLLILLIGPRVVSIITDWMWFSDLGYSEVMSTMITTRIVAFFVAAIVVGGIVFGGLFAAYRGRPDFPPVSGPGDPLERYRAVIGRRPWIAGVIPAVLIGLVAGLIAQASWATIQTFIHAESFGEKDPQFGMDISFYAFTLPFIRLILDLAFIAIGVAFVGNLITHYVFGGLRLGGGGRRGGLSGPARVQLAIIVGLFILLKAVGYWLDRYDLLSSDRRGDIFTGGTYTDINVVLPSKLILMAIAIVCAIAFFAAVALRDLRIPAMATVLMLLSALAIGVIWPAAMEQFSVKPSADSKEADYISRNIAATSDAYRIREGVDVKYEDRWTSAPADPAKVNADVATLSNIRVLDPAVVSKSFVQRQSLKNFYGFPDQLAVDRYPVQENGTKQSRDFIVSARELDPRKYNDNQQSWINKHTVFTHGNGFIAAFANTVDSPATDAASGTDGGGLPKFLVSDIESIRQPGYKNQPIQVKQPRVYFGEMIANVDPDYAIVGSADGKDREYDTDASTYTYTADSGVALSNVGTRLLYAIKYGERNLLLSDAINDNSKILYNRDPRDRVSKVAPWLTTDSKTYPAVMADGSVKWIVDGYTTLKNYPYAQRMSLSAATADSRAENAGQTARQQADEEVSYVRNSVKATVDAYTGEVTLYQFDTSDAVLKTWMKAFPGTVKPRSELDKNKDLLSHMRYPEDLFKLQRQLLTRYHVDNPADFYRANNFWSVPNDPTGDNTQLPQPPYYFTAAAPNTPGKSQFQLTSVTTPLNRQNLAAYITVGADPEGYGKLTVKTTPTDSQTVGPRQAQEAMKNAVARETTLVQGSVNITFGNLLTLPVGGNGVLYVQPLYTESKAGDSAMPKVFRMLTYYKSPVDGQVRIGAAPTIGDALKQVGIDPGAATEPDSDGSEPKTPDEKPTTPTVPNKSGPTQAQVDALDAAVAQMDAAQKSGDFAAIGDALKKLKAALADYPSGN